MPGTGAAWKYAYYPLPLPVANFSAKVIHMGKALGWAELDSLIEHIGEDGVLRMFCTRISEGESPIDIARSNGVPWYAFRGWLEDSSDRMNAWDLADRCFADGLVYEGLREVRNAGLEEVPLARMRDESYKKMAAKLNKLKWGEQKQGVVIEGMTMDQALGGFASMLLEKMQVVSVQPSAQHESPTGEVVENEVEKFSAQKFLTGEIDAE